MGLFVILCRGSDYDKPLEPFQIPFSLEMVDNKGDIFSRKIALSHIEANREGMFTGKNECGGGYGYTKFLSMHDLDNYMLSFQFNVD